MLVVKYEKISVSVTTPGKEFIKPWDSLLSGSCIHEQLLECLSSPNELTEGEAGYLKNLPGCQKDQKIRMFSHKHLWEG